MALICECDEQWRFIGSKARQLSLLTPFNIGMLTTDDWGSYAREPPQEKHLAGKIFT